MLPAESRVLKTVCSDKRCQSILYVCSSDVAVECYQCGQRHSKSSLHDLREVPEEDVKGVLQNYLYRMLVNQNVPKRGTEMVKVLGLSNYYCKILSPLLTRYGMDKNTGRAKLLVDMNQGEIFDCSLFGDRAFLIEPEHISIHGYGKDITGSSDYLSETLKLIVASNGGEERLIPIHADGDGHCLVHAISRALVGRELFWHPLRCCLKKHFETNIDKYKELFKDFIDSDEWPSIIEECDPNFQPPEGELHGLRNIHIFGLANVLRRPIILLDSLECMQKCGDYSALFLPGFVSPEACRGKDNTLNKPLCIAWSSYSHNHYIPLVGVQRKPLPVIPSVLIPKVWGMPQSEIYSYIEFDNNKNCVIGGNRSLSNAYIQRLVHAMEVLYYETNGIHPSLVADAKLYLFPDNVLFSIKPAAVLERARAAVQEGRLYRCLMCRSLCELRADDKFLPNNSAVCSQYHNYKRIQHDSNNAKMGLVLKYDSARNEYVIDFNNSEMESCTFCNYPRALRKVTNDGTVIYKAEDKDNLDRNIWHYDQMKKYVDEENISQKSTEDNKSGRMLLKLHWDGKEVQEEIACFDFRQKSKENLNEFVKDLAKKLIGKHFSGINVYVTAKHTFLLRLINNIFLNPSKYADRFLDKELQAYVSEEIWKLLRNSELRNISVLTSKSELKKQDSVKSVKLGNASAIGGQSKPPPAEIRYIKVVTSNGQQANFALAEEGVSYGQLQEWIRDEFNIPVRKQLIKKGFPPKQIKPVGDTNKQMLTDLKHGDRLMVEMQRKDENSSLLYDFASPKNVLKDSNIPKSTIKYPSDLSWEAIKLSPDHFRRNGFIYKKIAENHTLAHTLHTSLVEYPNKVFCYNHYSDSIELCVQPYGHFLISSDIDSRINEFKRGIPVLFFSACPLSNKSEEISDSVAFLRTFASSESAEPSNRPLRRMGPGFSVLSNPDDMDNS